MRLILLYTLLFTTWCSAQNLVLNGSFEDIIGPEYSAGVSSVKNWFQPTRGTTDYYHYNRHNVIDDYYGYGKMQPQNGKAFIGIICYPGSTYLKNDHEYFSTKLSSPLIAGKEYCVKMYEVLASNCDFAVNGLGIYLSDKITKRDDELVIDVQAQIRSDTILENKDSWKPICGIYKASGGEQYLTFGNFTKDKNLQKKNLRNGHGDKTSYYYIDNVSVVEVKGPTDCDCKTEYKIDIPSPETNTHRKPKSPASKPPKSDTVPVQKVVQTYVLQDVNFALNKAALSPTAYPTLNTIVTSLKAAPGNQIQINGYTDSLGTDEYNLKLSEERAKAVRDYLVLKGIRADRIQYEGLGKAAPVGDNSTEEGRQKNRRVEIRILKKW